MTPIQLEAKVGADGVLHLSVPLGSDEAAKRVIVTIQTCGREGNVASTGELYGSCVDLGLEEPPDLPLPPTISLE